MIDKIGQIFIVGYKGIDPSDDFKRFFSREQLGGVIFFEDNANPHYHAEKNIKDFIAESNVIPFFAVDQEGGRVCRFRGAPAEFDSPSKYAEKNNLELYAEQFGRAAYYLQSLGINLLLAPVADLNLDDQNPCLQGRTFGKSPARAIPFIERTIKIAHNFSLLTCAKHFPGLGASVIDPHHDLARADYDFQTFINREGITFQTAIEAGCDMIMTTHLILPQLDKEPATTSKAVVGNMLRGTLKFDGIAITDDLLMEGARVMGDYGERALKAFNAGHDILLFGQNFRVAEEVIKYFKKAYKKGLLNEERLTNSLERISGIKSKLTVPA